MWKVRLPPPLYVSGHLPTAGSLVAHHTGIGGVRRRVLLNHLVAVPEGRLRNIRVERAWLTRPGRTSGYHFVITHDIKDISPTLMEGAIQTRVSPINGGVRNTSGACSTSPMSALSGCARQEAPPP